MAIVEYVPTLHKKKWLITVDARSGREYRTLLTDRFGQVRKTVLIEVEGESFRQEPEAETGLVPVLNLEGMN